MPTEHMIADTDEKAVRYVRAAGVYGALLAPGRFGAYDNPSDAIRASSFAGEKVFRITVEEVEVPERRWWYVGQRDDKPILAEGTDETGPWISITQTYASVWRECRVQAYDHEGAKREARQAWRDLAANIAGGEA